MTAVDKSNKMGGKFGHMHIILNEKEYGIASKNNTVTVDLLAKPPNVHPDFQYKGPTNKVQSPPAGGHNKTQDNILPHSRRDIKGYSVTDGSKH